MQWSDLSDDAQNILEYLVGPRSDRRNEIRLQVGSAPSVSPDRPGHLATIVVDQPLIAEISSYFAETTETFEILGVSDAGVHMLISESSDLAMGSRP